MTLSGNIESFALSDVLTLLSSTAKTGRLDVVGDRGRGEVRVAAGDVVDASTERAPSGDRLAAVADLLRFRSGTFEFREIGEVDPTELGEAATVSDILEQAGVLVAEWSEIDAVVPNLSSTVSLRRYLDVPVTIDPDHWEVVGQVGRGCSGTELACVLGLSELDISRRLRVLAEDGIVEFSEVSDHRPDDAVGGFELVSAPGEDAETDVVDFTSEQVAEHAEDESFWDAPVEELCDEPVEGESDLASIGVVDLDEPEDVAEPFLQPFEEASSDHSAGDSTEREPDDAGPTAETSWSADDPTSPRDLVPEDELRSSDRQNLLLKFLSSAR